jgi:hypothetical protein
MFSQIFHAVENLSSQPTDERRESSSRSNSTDSPLRPSSPLSSSQLAESALVNLRKSLASQRAGSPVPKNAGARDPKSAKSTLEDRLRAAAFTIGEASNPSSAVVSTRASPTPPNSASQRPPSPSSTPLPESPKMSFETEANASLVHPVPSSIATPAVQLLSSSLQTSPSPEVSASTPEATRLEVDLPSDPADPIQDLSEAAPVVSSSSSSTDVEALQERLKQVEQRFTGMRCSFSKS